jgi:hypothetical protein
MTCQMHIAPGAHISRMVGKRNRLAVVECCNCLSRLSVEVDEDGTPCLETTRCHVDTCQTHLCPECVAVCESCDSPTCAEHLVATVDGKFCPCCVAAMVGEFALEALCSSK